MEAQDWIALRDEILYDGVLESDDRMTYEPFKFYFDQSGAEPGQTFPLSIDYDCMVGTMQNFLTGQPGANPIDASEVPGVQSVSLDLTAEGTWAVPADEQHVEGDPYPEGTQVRFYQTYMNFSLQSNIGDSNINAWLVQDRVRIHMIPVQTAGGTEYRIWKMRDIISLLRGTEDSYLGSILALYLGC